MCIPRRSLPIRQRSLVPKQDPVSCDAKILRSIGITLSRLFSGQRHPLEQSQTGFASASDASFIVLDFAPGKLRTTPFVLTQLFHPPTTPCDLASKPEHLESDNVLQTPLSLMNQVKKPILMQTGVLPVTLVLFCA